MLEIIAAKYLEEYKIEISFNTNETGVVDFASILKTESLPIFVPLNDIEFLKDFTVDYTLMWKKDIDFAPEFLYKEAFKHEAEKHPLIAQWDFPKYGEVAEDNANYSVD